MKLFSTLIYLGSGPNYLSIRQQCITRSVLSFNFLILYFYKLDFMISIYRYMVP